MAFAYLVPIYVTLQRSERTNSLALSEISCTGSVCDTSAFSTDWQSEGPDYLIQKQTRYLLNAPSSTDETPRRIATLDWCDTTFIESFREPKSFNTPDGEVWRLHSRDAISDGKAIEIIIGYAEQAPWKIGKSSSSSGEIRSADNELKREADRIASDPPTALRAVKSQKLSADGFAVVEAATGRVLTWGPWVPLFLRRDVYLPAPGRRLQTEGMELYIRQVDSNDRLVAISLVSVGNLWQLGILALLAFLITAAIARSLSRRFLRNYFAASGARVPNLQEACRLGEGQSIEFKRALSEDETKASYADDELLKSVAAFANTNDGVIFIGVDDSGKIRGLNLDFKQRDRFGQKIRQLVRNRIKPNPPVEITFEEVEVLAVARIAIARGEEPVYLLNGVIYVRSGSSDTQAQPEDLRRLVTEFA